MKAFLFPLLFTLAFFIGCNEQKDHHGQIQKQEHDGITNDIEHYLDVNSQEKNDQTHNKEREPNGVQH